jgi:hypothetical protein
MMSQLLFPGRGVHTYDVCRPQEEPTHRAQLSTSSTCPISTNDTVAILIDYSHHSDSVVDYEDKMGRLTDKLHQIVRKGSSGGGNADLESQLNTIGPGTYPRATRLQDGSILGVHTTFQNGANIIVATRSLDQGVSWNPVGEVTRGVGDIDNPFAVQLPSGNILCAFRNHTKNEHGQYTWFRITVCGSVDNGASWQYVSTADEVSLPSILCSSIKPNV